MNVCPTPAKTADAVSASRTTVEPFYRDVRLCGCTPIEWHDRLWATRGVQVVRRGRTAVDTNDPRLYLLVESDELVCFDCDVLHNTPSRDAFVVIALTQQSDPTYEERIERDDRSRFRRIRRNYRPSSGTSKEYYATTCAQSAEQWTAARDRHAADRMFRRSVGVDKLRRIAVFGATLSLTDEKDGVRSRYGFDDERTFDWLLSRFGVFEIDKILQCVGPGVYAHPAATISPRAKLIGPLWIGAGATIRADETILGPCVLPDEARVDTSAAGYGTLHNADKNRSVVVRRRGKRAFDIAFSTIALIAAAPLFPLIMLAITLEDGRPFLFPHKRQTRGGRTFKCFKFRTMRKNAERMKASLAAQNACDGPQFHIKHDPRVTRVGRWLRRTHLDELPQFWNVLRGDMHVVGPRPSPDSENQFCPTWREARLSVKPGVTGLWQVRRKRRPQTDFQEWIRYDLEYVRRQSWRLDLAIILRTAEQVIRKVLRRS